MDINTSSLAHIAFGGSSNVDWPATRGASESTRDVAAWFQGDASGARITLSAAMPDTADVAALAQRVLQHLTA